jgi:hypothetical protein
MSDQARKRVWTFGKHSNTQDFSDTPGTLRQKMPESAPTILSPRRTPIMRTAIRNDAKVPANFEGVKGLPEMSFEFAARGPSGSTGAAIVSATACEVADFLDTCLGAATDPANAVTTATGGTGATPNLTVTDGTDIPNGMVIGFLTDESSQYIVRQVVSGGGTGTLVLDRTYTGTVTAASNVLRAPRWVVNPTVHELTHCFLRGEADNKMREFFGCMGKVTLNLPVGDRATFGFSFMPTDVGDASELNPSFTVPTAGNAIVTNSNRFWVGNDAFMAVDLAVDFGGSMSPRRANSGPQGVQGYVVNRGGSNPVPVIRGKFYAGTNSTLGEVADSTGTFRANYAQGWDKSAGEAATTWDVALQAGNVAGGMLYVRAPSGVFTKFDEIEIDGLDGYEFELSCFDPASGYPIDLSLL